MSNNFQNFLTSNSVWSIYKKLSKSSKFSDEFFQSIFRWPKLSEHFCNIIIFKTGFMLNEENCQNMRERDVSVIKCILTMLIELIECNVKEDGLDECKFRIAISLTTMKHAVYLLDGYLCTQYGEECKNSQEHHYGVLYLCKNYGQCKLSTNCLKTLVSHMIPTLNMHTDNWPKCTSPYPYQYDSLNCDSFLRKHYLLTYEKVRQNNGHRFFNDNFMKEIKNNRKPFKLRGYQSSLFDTPIVKEEETEMLLNQSQNDELTGRLDLSGNALQSEVSFENQEENSFLVSSILEKSKAIISKAQKPQNLDQLNKEEIKSRVYESKLNSRILKSVQPSDDRFLKSVQEVYPSDKQNIVNISDAMVYFEQKNILSCFVCSQFIQENEFTFSNYYSPIILCHSDDTCSLFTVVHKSCLIEHYSNAQRPLAHYENINVLSCQCGMDIDLVYHFASESEEKKKAFELNSTNISCPFCLEKGTCLAHFKTCSSIGTRMTNGSYSNTLILQAMEIFFTKTHLKSSTFVQDFSLVLPKLKDIEFVDFRYPNINEQETHKNKDLKNDFEKSKIQIQLAETETSFRAVSLTHILRSIAAIVTNLKEYKLHGTQDAFANMLKKSEFMLAVLIRASRTIVHTRNCKLKALCLIGIDSHNVQHFISKGIEIVKVILDEHIDFFACVEHLHQNNEKTEYGTDERRDFEMNTLAYNFNFTKLNAKKTILSIENFKLKDKKHVDLMLQNKIDSFEEKANILKNTTIALNNKRKHQYINTERSKKLKQ